ESILEGTPHQAIALDASAGQRPGMVDLAQALARLAALGYPVKLTAWDEGAPPAPIETGKPTLTVPICGANYRKPRPVSPSTPGPLSHEGRGGRGVRENPAASLSTDHSPLSTQHSPVTPMSADTPPNLSH